MAVTAHAVLLRSHVTSESITNNFVDSTSRLPIGLRHLEFCSEQLSHGRYYALFSTHLHRCTLYSYRYTQRVYTRLT